MRRDTLLELLRMEAAEAAAGVLAGYLISALIPQRWALALARPALRAMRLGPDLAPAVVAALAGPGRPRRAPTIAVVHLGATPRQSS
ncbi:MAG: hypothetical protein LM577_02485 [Thermoproteaceae archaeon]|jgi:hypothetical protein|nr:hypothetical protein [Thermoproteaceae archaeon]